MIEEVAITAGSREIGGWEDFRFEQSTDEPAGKFSFQSSKNPANLTEPSVQDGVIQIKANAELLLTGYVEDLDLSIDPQGGRVLNISGRSKAADLIDSSVSGNFRRQNTLQIIEKLAAPFGIEIETDGSQWDDFLTYTPEFGQRVIGAIYNGLQLQQKTLSVTSAGNLRIWDADNRPSQGAIGRGIERANVKINTTRRFSEYGAYGQDAAWFEGVQASEIAGRAEDAAMRFRPKVFFPDMEMTTPRAKEAANRAAKRGFGKSNQISVTVTGWRNDDGEIWAPNSRVWVDLPEVGSAGDMVIQSVSLSQSLTTGTTADLTMEPLSAHTSDGSGGARSATVARRPEIVAAARAEPTSQQPDRQISEFFQNDRFRGL